MEVKNKLKKLTNHKKIILTNSGNSAIFLSLVIAKELGKKTILIPDQGGWLTYKTFPEMLGLKIMEVKTDYGIFLPDELDIDKNCAIIVPSLAGYFAQQPLQEISKVCEQKECLLIEDASGAIGNKRLCNGSSDIVVGSFGKGKPVNLKYGGFLSADNLPKIDLQLIKMLKFHKLFEIQLLEKLEKIEQRINFFQKTSKKIKNDLNSFDIIHKDKQGINVVVKFKSKEEKEKIIQYCQTNKYEYTLCPRYIRVMDNAISIEVKRLEVEK